MRPVDRSIIFSVWCCGQLGAHPTKTLLALGTMAKRGAQPVAGMILADLDNSRCCSVIGFYGISGQPFIASDNLCERSS
jgi:hypothetical protein